LERRLGEGGFGEVWLGKHDVLKETRVFKFCFKLEKVRALKRELTLFRILAEKVGKHPNLIGVQEVNLESAPFYLMMDYGGGPDLRTSPALCSPRTSVSSSRNADLIQRQQAGDNILRCLGSDMGRLHRKARVFVGPPQLTALYPSRG